MPKEKWENYKKGKSCFINIKRLVRGINEKKRKDKFKIFENLDFPKPLKYYFLALCPNDYKKYLKIEESGWKKIINIKIPKKDLNNNIKEYSRFFKINEKEYPKHLINDSSDYLEMEFCEKVFQYYEQEVVERIPLRSEFKVEYTFIEINNSTIERVLKPEQKESIEIRVPFSELEFFEMPVSLQDEGLIDSPRFKDFKVIEKRLLQEKQENKNMYI